MTRSFFILSCVLSMLISLVALPAQADTCLSSGVTVDENGKLTGVCTPSASGTSNTVTSTPGNGGVYSCNAPASGSIGATSAIGGTYVPVADAAVELNTGILVYEECILRPLFNQQKQAATVAIASNNYQEISKGNNGNPRWLVNYGKESSDVAQQAVVDTYNSGVYKTINPAFQNQVTTAVLRNYQYITQQPQNALTCPYQGDWGAVINNPTQNFSWNAVFAAANPACDPVFAYTTAQEIRDANIGSYQSQWLNQLNWGRGLYSVTDNGKFNGNVVVPALFLDAVSTQSITSGFRQLENANDIGQMVGSFFSGIGSNLLSGPSSVASVQKAYSDAVKQQQGSLASSVVSAAQANLNKILAWEQQYNDLQEQMASVISDAILQLRGAENKCWDLIQQNVCSTSASSTTSGSGTCTGKSGATLTIATSTAFSNAVINSSNFATLASTLADRIDVSNQNLSTINTLITNVGSTDSATRNAALQQLDTIVAASPPVLHTQTNITQAQDELSSLKSAISDTTSGLVEVAIHRWAGDDTSGNTGTLSWGGVLPPTTSNDAGWCNINKQQTLDNWTSAWTK